LPKAISGSSAWSQRIGDPISFDTSLAAARKSVLTGKGNGRF
jgi:hypothetical protein